MVVANEQKWYSTSLNVVALRAAWIGLCCQRSAVPLAIPPFTFRISSISFVRFSVTDLCICACACAYVCPVMRTLDIFESHFNVLMAMKISSNCCVAAPGSRYIRGHIRWGSMHVSLGACLENFHYQSVVSAWLSCGAHQQTGWCAAFNASLWNTTIPMMFSISGVSEIYTRLYVMLSTQELHSIVWLCKNQQVKYGSQFWCMFGHISSLRQANKTAQFWKRTIKNKIIQQESFHMTTFLVMSRTSWSLSTF